jgi:hypothetical protein
MLKAYNARDQHTVGEVLATEEEEITEKDKELFCWSQSDFSN